MTKHYNIDEKKLLVVIDMQNDFLTGPLGNEQTAGVVGTVEGIVNSFPGWRVFTKDTHYDNYLETQEGEKLPVVHCIEGTEGWELCDLLKGMQVPDGEFKNVFIKNTFGSTELAEYIKKEGFEEVYLCGVCTGICVISNALLIKAVNPEIKIRVIEDACACVTPETHKNAIEAMKLCQIEIVKEDEVPVMELVDD